MNNQCVAMVTVLFMSTTNYLTTIANIIPNVRTWNKQMTHQAGHDTLLKFRIEHHWTMHDGLVASNVHDAA